MTERHQPKIEKQDSGRQREIAWKTGKYEITKKFRLVPRKCGKFNEQQVCDDVRNFVTLGFMIRKAELC